MLPAGVGDAFQRTVLEGSLALAVPVAVLAGLVSFLSPCVLPLVPGYLSYVTGMAGTDLDRVRKGRVVAGATLFVLGFTAVFVSFGALFGGLGGLLLAHGDVITRVLGVVTVVLGLAFLGILPGLQREWRVHRRPAVGLAGAPVLGIVFGLGWTPCIGPTLAAVQTLALSSASAGRGALLTAAYCAGLGLPFLAAAVAYRRALAAFGWVRRHSLWVVRLGGVLLVVLGFLLTTGLWDTLTIQLRIWAGGFETAV